MDNTIVLSKDEQSHIAHVNQIFNTFEQAYMKIQLDKCEFFKEEVEFLGFVVSKKGIKKKVETILKFDYHKTLKEIRTFWGLSGYYAYNFL